MKGATETLKTMLEQKVGYRNENYQGSGERLANDVIRFEIQDLGNTDILATMTDFYGLDFSEYLDEEGEVNFELILELMDEILSFLEKKLSTTRDNIEVIWLSTEDMVKKLYSVLGDFSEFDYVVKVPILDTWIPISDLGADGTLFACKKGDL